jgi:hypothetical protein
MRILVSFRFGRIGSRPNPHRVRAFHCKRSRGMTDPRIPESKQKEAELPDDLDQTPGDADREEADVEREMPPGDPGEAIS